MGYGLWLGCEFKGQFLTLTEVGEVILDDEKGRGYSIFDYSTLEYVTGEELLFALVFPKKEKFHWVEEGF